MQDFDGGANLPRRTSYKPGTEAKIRVLRRRALLRQELFNPSDERLDMRDGWLGEQAGGDNVFMLALLREGEDGQVERVETKAERTKRHRTEQERFAAFVNKERERKRKRAERALKRIAKEALRML